MEDSSTHEFQPPKATFFPPHGSHLHGEGSQEAMKEGGYGAALPHDAGGGEGVPRAAGAAAATLRSSLPSPPSSPPSPSPSLSCIQWFILP